MMDRLIFKTCSCCCIGEGGGSGACDTKSGRLVQLAVSFLLCQTIGQTFAKTGYPTALPDDIASLPALVQAFA